MKGTTEYRDAYCWFFGGREQSPDSYEEMIKEKIAGTYRNDENQFAKTVPKFKFELEAEGKEKIVPTPKTIVGTNNPQPAASRKSLVDLKKEAKRKQEEEKRAKKNGSGRGKFASYGMGNVHPTNDELFMTTYNIKADTGVNPYTVMKSRIRPYILSEYARPKPVTSVRVHTPNFFASPKDMTEEQQLQMDGPFWVYWPSSKPFPKEYSELEKIVRPSTE